MALSTTYLQDIDIQETAKGITATVEWIAPWPEAYRIPAPSWRPIKNQTKLIDSLGWPNTSKYAGLVCRSISINQLAGASTTTTAGERHADSCRFRAVYSTAEWIDSAIRYSQKPLNEFVQIASIITLANGRTVTDPVYRRLGSREIGVERTMVYDGYLIDRVNSIADKLNDNTISGGYERFAKGTLYCMAPTIGPTRRDYERNLDLTTVQFIFTWRPYDHNMAYDAASNEWSLMVPAPYDYADFGWVWQQ